jgi:hypothetical protein
MKNYPISDFLSGYAQGKGFDSPEAWLEEYVVTQLSNKITTIVDFGCAHGRNFLPFPKEKYEYVGFDIHDFINISWVYDINVKYNTCSMLDFLNDHKDYNVDWKNSLVICHGTLMYLDNSSQQNTFIDILKDLGCENFVFHEYGSDILIKNGNLSEHARDGKLGYLDLNKNNKKMFQPPYGTISRFRDFENDMCAFINLNK